MMGETVFVKQFDGRCKILCFWDGGKRSNQGQTTFLLKSNRGPSPIIQVQRRFKMERIDPEDWYGGGEGDQYFWE